MQIHGEIIHYTMLLKDLLSPEFIEELSSHLQALLSDFDRSDFSHQVFDDQWEGRELKERIRHISRTLHGFLPADFTEASALLVTLAHRVRESADGLVNFGYLFLPDYVEVYGLDHFDRSVAALEEITQLMSAEFAVRPFLIRYPGPMMRQMQAWAKHHSPHVRRLSSEGCRPRLPWAMKVPFLMEDPSPILPILETLKNDPVEFVRRSVANSLNDISKDHPEVVLAIANRWQGSDPEIDKLLKHGCRTLLKQGHQEAIRLFGYSNTDHLEVKGLKLINPRLSVGEDLEFEFEVKNTGKAPHSLRLEYAVYFLRANGRHARKVFKISEREIVGNTTLSVRRRQHFRPITTRRYYPGEHFLGIIVNGVEMGKAGFRLE